MLIEFRDSDRMLGLKAIDLYRKGIESAKGACEKVYASTLMLQEADSLAKGAESFILNSLEEMGVGEVREIDMRHELALSLRMACSVYLGQLSKLAEKEGDLFVALDNTNNLMSLLQSLADRLNGQTELHGISTVTIESGGQSVTMTGDQLSRAAGRIGRRAKRKEKDD